MNTQPNFVVILTDDHGYGDLSCMGSQDFHTPHLDALAAGGARFTSFYANAPVSSPTRAALLTGRYPGNAGVRSILRGHRTSTGLPSSVPTFARALRDAGYFTAMSGKWHLGLADGCRPRDHGFDQWFGHLAGCIDFFSHIFYWDKSIDPLHDLWDNDKEVWRNGQYMTQLITERAIDYIRQAKARQQPFVLYVAYNAPHYPMHAPRKYLDRFPHLSPERRIMAAMISAVDDGVGDIVAELERQGVGDNTCVFFTSDNGPSRETRNWLDGRTDPYYGGTTGPFKGHKFSLFEGGLRVPGIANFPRRFSPGQVIDTPAASMDIMPTLLALAGVDARDLELNGADLSGMLTQGAPLPPRDLFFEQSNQTALRRGPWKLVLNGRLVETEGPVADVFLANLDDDPAESRNLADSHPEKLGDLRAAAESWRQAIDARWTAQWLPLQT
ncbi:MAG: sulfatase-like hydrolase/transferase [Phycisphaeraceae bacterium]